MHQLTRSRTIRISFTTLTASRLPNHTQFDAQHLQKAVALPFSVHPQMLRHACGFALADQRAGTKLIQDCLGHRNIQHTVRYTADKLRAVVAVNPCFTKGPRRCGFCR
jgi:integrase